MTKNSVIILRPNMTFSEKMVSTLETKLLLSKDIQPEFTPGCSVFHETGISRFKFWKKQRKLVIVAEGAMQAFEYKEENPGLVPHWWTLADARKFVAQMIAKTKGQMKPFSNWQVFGLMALLIMVIILQIVTLRGGRL